MFDHNHNQAPKKVIRKARKPSVLKPGFAYDPAHSSVPFGELDDNDDDRACSNQAKPGLIDDYFDDCDDDND